MFLDALNHWFNINASIELKITLSSDIYHCSKKKDFEK